MTNLLRRAPAWPAWTGVAIVVVVLLPGWVSRADADTLTTMATLVAMTQGWNVIGGLGGQFSLANHAFVGAGGYTAALIMLHSGLPLWVGVLAGGVVSAAIAAVSSFALLRLRGVYFSIGSLAVALAIQSWMFTWNWAGGTQGLSFPPEAIPLQSTLLRGAGVVAVLSCLVVHLLRGSRFGLRLMAVRDHEEAATGLGVRGFTVKLTAFAISAFVTGVAGALVAVQQISIEPVSAFGLTFTINMVIMAIIGGIGTTAGPVVGVFVVYYCLQRQLESLENVSTILSGALVVLVIRFAPGGVWPMLRNGWTAARRLSPRRARAAPR